MRITKKFDRAFQWAGEKMGGEARTTLSDDFKMLQTEMTLRQDGMERLQKSMAIYNKWMSRRCDAFEDKERATPMAQFGRTMAAHGDDFEPDSEFGSCLSTLGRTNERVAMIQDNYVETANGTWLDHLERSVAQMKEYQNARKKLENRRLAYDASMAKMQKAKREDFRIEEEVRMSKVKFEESSEDVFRRMQDIKEAEVDSVVAVTSLLDAELDYHERCAEELRAARQAWAVDGSVGHSPARAQPRLRSRSNTARSWQEPRQSAVFEEPEPHSQHYVSPARPIHQVPRSRPSPPPPPQPPRPKMTRAVTESRTVSSGSQRPPLPQLARVATDSAAYGQRNEDIFADDASTNSGSRSPEWGERSASPATSYGSMSRSTSGFGNRKAPPPPPPPVNRAKKPPPPVPAKKAALGY